MGKSKDIGKWGAFFDLVDRVLLRKDLKLKIIHLKKEKDFISSNDGHDCCDDVCAMPPRKDKFDILDRFKDIELFGFSTFCRGLMRW